MAALHSLAQQAISQPAVIVAARQSHQTPTAEAVMLLSAVEKQKMKVNRAVKWFLAMGSNRRDKNVQKQYSIIFYIMTYHSTVGI